MSKLNNYIFLTIAEVTFDTFKNTEFSTYSNYCRNMGMCIRSNNLSTKQRMCVNVIFDTLQLIYAFDDKTIGRYVAAYFDLEDFTPFEMYVRNMKEFFPEAFN